MEDRVLVYRGADQPDMSVINPESDVWQHIKVGICALLVKLWLNHLADAYPISRYPMAHQTSMHQLRWQTYSYCWSTRSITLQCFVREVEAVCSRRR